MYKVQRPSFAPTNKLDESVLTGTFITYNISQLGPKGEELAFGANVHSPGAFGGATWGHGRSCARSENKLSPLDN